jgi:hypothetical protein
LQSLPLSQAATVLARLKRVLGMLPNPSHEHEEILDIVRTLEAGDDAAEVG